MIYFAFVVLFIYLMVLFVKGAMSFETAKYHGKCNMCHEGNIVTEYSGDHYHDTKCPECGHEEWDT